MRYAFLLLLLFCFLFFVFFGGCFWRRRGVLGKVGVGGGDGEGDMEDFAGQGGGMGIYGIVGREYEIGGIQ